MMNYIKGVALLGTDDKIHHLPEPNRHSDVYKLLLEQNYSHEYIKSCIQGFLTNNNEFKNRKESYIIAEQANQLLHKSDIKLDDCGLISEDLW